MSGLALPPRSTRRVAMAGFAAALVTMLLSWLVRSTSGSVAGIPAATLAPLLLIVSTVGLLVGAWFAVDG